MADVVWREVLSSNVRRLGWQDDPPALLVEWVNNKHGTSEYSGVDAATFEEGTKAPSVGTWLNSQIKGKYQHRYI